MHFSTALTVLAIPLFFNFAVPAPAALLIDRDLPPSRVEAVLVPRQSLPSISQVAPTQSQPSSSNAGLSAGNQNGSNDTMNNGPSGGSDNNSNNPTCTYDNFDALCDVGSNDGNVNVSPTVGNVSV